MNSTIRRNSQGNSIRPIDFITVFLLFYYVDFSFYPLESYLAGGDDEVALPVPLTTISLVVVSVLVLLYVAKSKGRVKILGGAPLLFIFVLFAFISAAWSSDAALTIKRALRYLPTMTLGVVFAQYYPLRRILRMMVLAVFLSACLGIVFAVAIPGLGISRIGGAYESAWRGVQSHKNFTGDIMATGILILFGAGMTKNISLPLTICAGLPIALLLIMSSSGTSLMAAVAAIAATLALFVIRPLPKKLRPFLLFALLCFVFASSIAVYMNVGVFFDSAGRDLTFTGRTFIWEAVWQKIWENPILGWGYGMWVNPNDSTNIWIKMMSGDVGTAHSHQTWLDVWLQLGIIPLGIIVYCSLYLLVASVYRLLWCSDNEAVVYIALAVYIWVRSFLEIQFTDPWMAGLFWLSWSLTRLKVTKPRLIPRRSLRNTQYDKQQFSFNLKGN